VAASARQLKKKSHKTRAGVFTVLREVVSALPGDLNTHFTALVPGVVSALSVRPLAVPRGDARLTTPRTQDVKGASDMRLAALEFVYAAVTTHSATVVQPHIKALAPLAFANSADGLAQLSATALRVIGELVLVSRPEKGQPGAGFDYKPLVKDAFAAVLARLKLLDVDPAIKESSIAAMGVVLARYGDELGDQLSIVLPVLMQRLANEITRLTTVQALYRIAASDVVVNLKPVLEETYKEMAQLLRKISHQIKQASLLALEALTARYGKDVAPALHAAVLTEAAALVSCVLASRAASAPLVV
jgi:cullin-associated NEDD8-dissociated protein 1